MQLAGAILDYARLPPSYQSTIRTKSAIVEVTDLSYRFREKPDAITAALSLMKEMGFAQELKQKGIWRIQLVKRASYKDSNHNEGAA
jgi:hypothetical protein